MEKSGQKGICQSVGQVGKACNGTAFDRRDLAIALRNFDLLSTRNAHYQRIQPYRWPVPQRRTCGSGDRSRTQLQRHTAPATQRLKASNVGILESGSRRNAGRSRRGAFVVRETIPLKCVDERNTEPIKSEGSSRGDNRGAKTHALSTLEPTAVRRIVPTYNNTGANSPLVVSACTAPMMMMMLASHSDRSLAGEQV